MTQGVVYVHAAPAPLCPHVEWAISGVVGSRVSLSWTAQPAAPGMLRADIAWRGPVGTAGALAKALTAWPMLRFEITEQPSDGVDGERICQVPGRKIWRASTSANGDLVVGEDRLRALLTGASSVDVVQHRLNELLGTDIDAELEPFRRAGDGTAVTWLHQVG